MELAICDDSNLRSKEHDWKVPPAPNIGTSESHPTVTKVQTPLIKKGSLHNHPVLVSSTPDPPKNTQTDHTDDHSHASDYESIRTEFRHWEVPPGSLFDDAAPPPSPTNVCDYPYYDQDRDAYKYSEGLWLDVSSKHKLPRIKRTVSDLRPHNSEEEAEEESALITSVVTESLVADIGVFAPSVICNRLATGNGVGKMADSGANCSMTNNLTLLKNVRQLLKPIQVGVAVDAKGTDMSYATCNMIGDLTITCKDGSTISTQCFYNPHATDTIISPQAILEESLEFDSWSQVGRRLGNAGELQFHGKNGTKAIELAQNNGLYYCKSITFDIDHDFLLSHEPD